MADVYTITAKVPMKAQQVYVAKDFYFFSESGLHHLPAGVHNAPMPVWEKLTIDYASNNLGEKNVAD